MPRRAGSVCLEPLSSHLSRSPHPYPQPSTFYQQHHVDKSLIQKQIKQQRQELERQLTSADAPFSSPTSCLPPLPVSGAPSSLSLTLDIPSSPHEHPHTIITSNNHTLQISPTNNHDENALHVPMASLSPPSRSVSPSLSPSSSSAGLSPSMRLQLPRANSKRGSIRSEADELLHEKKRELESMRLQLLEYQQHLRSSVPLASPASALALADADADELQRDKQQSNSSTHQTFAQHQHLLTDAEFQSLLTKSPSTRSPSDVYSLFQYVRGLRVHFFHDMDDSTLQLLCVNMRLASFTPKQVVMREGTRSDRLYVILNGSVSIWVNHLRDRDFDEQDAQEEEESDHAHSTLFRKTHRTRFITMVHCSPGQHAVFGELGLLSDVLRTATVVAEGGSPGSPALDVNFITIDKQEFDLVIKQREKIKFQEKIEALKTLKIFTHISTRQIIKISIYFESKLFPSHHNVICAGSEANTIFIVYRGEIEVLQPMSKQRQVSVGLIGDGELIGEASLFYHQLHRYTYRTTKPTILFMIHQDDFLKRLRVDVLKDLRRNSFAKKHMRTQLKQTRKHVERHIHTTSKPFQHTLKLFQQTQGHNFHHLTPHKNLQHLVHQHIPPQVVSNTHLQALTSSPESDTSSTSLIPYTAIPGASLIQRASAPAASLNTDINQQQQQQHFESTQNKCLEIVSVTKQAEKTSHIVAPQTTNFSLTTTLPSLDVTTSPLSDYARPFTAPFPLASSSSTYDTVSARLLTPPSHSTRDTSTLAASIGSTTAAKPNNVQSSLLQQTNPFQFDSPSNQLSSEQYQIPYRSAPTSTLHFYCALSPRPPSTARVKSRPASNVPSPIPSPPASRPSSRLSRSGSPSPRANSAVTPHAPLLGGNTSKSNDPGGHSKHQIVVSAPPQPFAPPPASPAAPASTSGLQAPVIMSPDAPFPPLLPVPSFSHQTTTYLATPPTKQLYDDPLQKYTFKRSAVQYQRGDKQRYNIRNNNSIVDQITDNSSLPKESMGTSRTLHSSSSSQLANNSSSDLPLSASAQLQVVRRAGSIVQSDSLPTSPSSQQLLSPLPLSPRSEAIENSHESNAFTFSRQSSQNNETVSSNGNVGVSLQSAPVDSQQQPQPSSQQPSVPSENINSAHSLPIPRPNQNAFFIESDNDSEEDDDIALISPSSADHLLLLSPRSPSSTKSNSNLHSSPLSSRHEWQKEVIKWDKQLEYWHRKLVSSQWWYGDAHAASGGAVSIIVPNNVDIYTTRTHLPKQVLASPLTLIAISRPEPKQPVSYLYPSSRDTNSIMQTRSLNNALSRLQKKQYEREVAIVQSRKKGRKPQPAPKPAPAPSSIPLVHSSIPPLPHLDTLPTLTHQGVYIKSLLNKSPESPFNVDLSNEDPPLNSPEQTASSNETAASPLVSDSPSSAHQELKVVAKSMQPRADDSLKHSSAVKKPRPHATSKDITMHINTAVDNPIGERSSAPHTSIDSTLPVEPWSASSTVTTPAHAFEATLQLSNRRQLQPSSNHQINADHAISLEPSNLAPSLNLKSRASSPSPSATPIHNHASSANSAAQSAPTSSAHDIAHHANQQSHSHSDHLISADSSLNPDESELQLLLFMMQSLSQPKCLRTLLIQSNTISDVAPSPTPSHAHLSHSPDDQLPSMFSSRAASPSAFSGFCRSSLSSPQPSSSDEVAPTLDENLTPVINTLLASKLASALIKPDYEDELGLQYPFFESNYPAAPSKFGVNDEMLNDSKFKFPPVSPHSLLVNAQDSSRSQQHEMAAIVQAKMHATARTWSKRTPEQILEAQRIEQEYNLVVQQFHDQASNQSTHVDSLHSTPPVQRQLIALTQSNPNAPPLLYAQTPHLYHWNAMTQSFVCVDSNGSVPSTGSSSGAHVSLDSLTQSLRAEHPTPIPLIPTPPDTQSLDSLNLEIAVYRRDLRILRKDLNRKNQPLVSPPLRLPRAVDGEKGFFQDVSQRGEGKRLMEQKRAAMEKRFHRNMRGSDKTPMQKILKLRHVASPRSDEKHDSDEEASQSVRFWRGGFPAQRFRFNQQHKHISSNQITQTANMQETKQIVNPSTINLNEPISNVSHVSAVSAVTAGAAAAAAAAPITTRAICSVSPSSVLPSPPVSSRGSSVSLLCAPSIVTPHLSDVVTRVRAATFQATDTSSVIEAAQAERIQVEIEKWKEKRTKHTLLSTNQYQ